MFGTLVMMDSDAAVFHSVWTYAIKAVDGRKKAHWACDGLPRSGQAKVLDETYANCADILLNMLNDRLTIPIKRQGFLDMYNGIDVYQTRDYIKIACTSFANKCCDKYVDTSMKTYMMLGSQPTPLPSDPTWMKEFNLATGDPDKKVQAKLGRDMKLLYCSEVGELIWAMTTCRPDLAYVVVKLSQANHCPHEHHYLSTCMSQKMMGYTSGG